MACHFNKMIIFLFLLVFTLFWESSFGWRWKTRDSVIQDVWPELTSSSSIKLRRASTRSIGGPSGSNTVIIPESKLEETPVKSTEDSEDDLVFEGHYFKPSEVHLAPPPFMVGSNWRGSVGTGYTQQTKEQEQLRTLYKEQRPSSYFVVGIGNAPPLPAPPVQKFTEENVKIPNENATKEVASEEKIHSSSNANPKTVSFSTPSNLELPTLEEIFYYEDRDLEILEMFKDAPKCFTPTDTEGKCIEFKQCFPVAFNVIDGELRNPGLAKLLYHVSGPCNATLELEFALRSKLSDETAFLNANFYNQSVCCPGFKYPPRSTLKSWPSEVRSARLITSDDAERRSSPSVSLDVSPAGPVNSSHDSPFQSSSTDHSVYRHSDESIEIKSKLDNIPNAKLDFTSKAPVLGPDDSSVEVETEEVEANHGIIITVEDDTDDEQSGGEEFGEIILEKENLNDTSIVRESKGDSKNSDKEERRGDRDKEEYNEKLKIDAFSAVPAPNLSPMTCRQQIYGMPRGHWPWMVALVISSRHICSGALVDERYIITASHCIFQLSEEEIRKLRVIIGDRVMYSTVDGPHFWRKVTKIITHANYNQHTFASDIAVLRLNSAVPFSRNIQPISLPEPSSVDTSLLYQKGIVAGWSGADIGQPAFEARTEVETVVDIMDKQECREIYRGFALSGLASNTFCTKPANNTCVADSGAPLVVRSQNCWLLMGVMSYGVGCSYFPEVYTDVSKFSTWIKKHIHSN